MRLTAFVAALLIAVSADAQEQAPNDAGRIAGHVVSAYAELMPGVTVTLGGRDNQGVVRAQTMTDTRGAFSFEQLPPGRYRVMASRQGYTGRQVPDLQAAPGEFFEAGPAVDLTEGAQVLDVQVVFTVRRASPGASFVLTGALRRTCASRSRSDRASDDDH